MAEKYELSPITLAKHINEIHFKRVGETGMQRKIKLYNGFTATGHGDCVTPKYASLLDETMGKAIAFKDAEQKILLAMDYYEKQQGYEEKFLPWLGRAKDELSRLDRKRAKLTNLLAGDRPRYLSQTELERLRMHLDAMSVYAFTLSNLIIDAEKH